MNRILKAVLLTSAIIGISAVGACAFKKASKEYTSETYPLKYKAEVMEASEKYDISPALIYGVIKTESNFKPQSESNAGAVGLMQLTEDTFIWLQTYYKDENELSFEDLKEPEINIDYGTHVLSILFDMYQDEKTVLCAYNAGMGTVDDWLENKEYSEDGKTLTTVPYPETDNYHRLVMQNESVYNKLYFSKDSSTIEESA